MSELHKTIGALKHRFREDFRYATMILFGSLFLLFISGFIVLSLIFGHTYTALVNACIALGLVFVLMHAIRAEQLDRAGLLFVVFNMAACIATTVTSGTSGLYWAYLVLWVNFLMAPQRIALGASLALIIGLLLTESLFDSQQEMTTFLVTSLLITVFSLVFVDRLQRQQLLLEQLAMQDPLTRIGNRRMMKDQIVQALARHQRQQQPATLVLMDLDHFKDVNDQQGHEAGDSVLLRFVETMNSNIRTGDGFFRFGGEEFILLLPEHDEAEGLEVARKIHQRVSGVVEQSGWTLRYSAGVSGLRPEDTVNTWLMRTDQALYQAKHTGRNQVLCWNQDMLTTPSGLRFDEQAVTDT